MVHVSYTYPAMTSLIQTKNVWQWKDQERDEEHGENGKGRGKDKKGGSGRMEGSHLTLDYRSASIATNLAKYV